MDLTPIENWSPTSTDQSAVSVEASLCVSRRFGILKDINSVAYALEVEMRTVLKEFGLRAQDIKVKSRPARLNRRNTLVLVIATLVGKPKLDPDLKYRLLYQMKDIEDNHKRADSPYVSFHGANQS